MKRFAVLIMLLYFAGLSLEPCRDMTNAAQNFYSAQITANSGGQLGDPKEEICQEECSPLCICSCCGIAFAHTAYPSTFFSTLIIDSKKEINFLYRSPLALTYNGSVWEPPRI